MAKPPRQSGRKVSFTPEAAKRIASAVMKVEGGNRDQGGVGLRTSSGGDELVRATFTGDWAKGDEKTCNDAVLTAVEIKAKNYLVGLAVSGEATCVLAYTSGEWVLAGWDWHALAGYSAGSQQVLAHDANGGLSWINTTACS
jgi:hypothetical protein